MPRPNDASTNQQLRPLAHSTTSKDLSRPQSRPRLQSYRSRRPGTRQIPRQTTRQQSERPQARPPDSIQKTSSELPPARPPARPPATPPATPPNDLLSTVANNTLSCWVWLSTLRTGFFTCSSKIVKALKHTLDEKVKKLLQFRRCIGSTVAIRQTQTDSRC
jgi:hypothetical protein